MGRIMHTILLFHVPSTSISIVFIFNKKVLSTFCFDNHLGEKLAWINLDWRIYSILTYEFLLIWGTHINVLYKGDSNSIKKSIGCKNWFDFIFLEYVLTSQQFRHINHCVQYAKTTDLKIFSIVLVIPSWFWFDMTLATLILNMW